MSGFRSAAGAVALAVLTGSIGCGGSSSSSSSGGTAPSAVTYTDTFTGTVVQGSTSTNASYGTDNQNHFTIHAPGNITATLTKLAPLSTITVGVGLGVYDAGSSTCTLQLTSDTAKLNVALSASIGVTAELCVGVYDVGNLVGPIDYEVSITHT